MTTYLESLPIFESHWVWSMTRNQPARCTGQMRILEDSDDRWLNLKCDVCLQEWGCPRPKPLTSSTPVPPADLAHDPEARNNEI